MTRDLGFLAAVPREYAIELSCHHCDVTWTGCADESYCPECLAPKGYWPGDFNRCYCEVCETPAADESDRG